MLPPEQRHGSKRDLEYALASLIVDVARKAGAAYAADREEPPWADDIVSRAIWAEYQRVRAEQRARDVAAFEAEL